MNEKVNVLFISPFDDMDMRESIERIGSQYPEINLTVSVGNQADGLRLVQDSYGANFDCVISRGNTATMIRKAVSVPVVNVKVTLNDVLASISDLDRLPPVIAAVGYYSIVEGMDYLNSVLPFDLEVFGIEDPGELDGVFGELDRRGIGLMVCDTVTYRIASDRGRRAYILRSGEDSIRYAFEQVMFLSRTNSTMLMENQLLRRLVSVNSESKVVVFDSDRQLYYSSLPENDFIMECLRERLPDFEKCEQFRIARRQDGRAYRVTARRVTVVGQVYFAYFLTWKNLGPRNDHRSIRYLDEAGVRRELENSVFTAAGFERLYSQPLRSAVSGTAPVLIYGEIGTGKNRLAELVYLGDKYVKNPFAIIDCTLMNSRSWDYLINRSDSPLWDKGTTIFIKNIDALESERIRELVATLAEGDVPRRNRVIISCSAHRGLSSMSGIPVLKLIEQLGCSLITTVPLRGDPELISGAAEMLWESLREETPGLGPLSPEAMAQLARHIWPQNLDQLVRVLSTAARLAGDGPLTGETAARVLTAEESLAPGETSSTANTILDLTKPLSEINRDIARLILAQNGGNQSAAARSLGISRTTFWNMLRK